MSIDRAFAGHEVVKERYFRSYDDEAGMRELHYQPVTDPRVRVVAVSVAISQPAQPALQRARTMQQLTKLAGGVSHETNNLLNVLMSNADLLADRVARLGDEEALKRLERIEYAIELRARRPRLASPKNFAVTKRAWWTR